MQITRRQVCVRLPLALIVVMIGAEPAFAQEFEAPAVLRSVMQPYRVETGVLRNPSDSSRVVFTQVISVPDARWVRLYFSEAILEPGSFVRMTSLSDGEVQELDAQGLAKWSNSSAYLNGGRVRVELIAAPRSQANRLSVEEVAVNFFDPNDGQLCGVCTTDNRVPTAFDFAGRILPVGCSSAVYTPDSCLISAGHCVTGGNVVQFRVPLSVDCEWQHPPVADQFPIVASLSASGGPGNDWAVMRTGMNNLNQTIVERYGEFRPISTVTPTPGMNIEAIGYGVTMNCTTTRIQQRSPGSISSLWAGEGFLHNAVTTLGNSGSGLFFNNEIIGVATHCGNPCPNLGQRMDFPPFVAARQQLCPSLVPQNDNCADALIRGVGTHPFTTLYATTDGPDEPQHCNFNGFTHIHNDVWYRHLATCTGTLTVSVCGANFNTKIAAYQGCPSGTGQALACNDDFCSQASQISFPVTYGTVYRIRIGGVNGAMGSGNMTISCTPACPADISPPGGDGVVNVNDLLAVINAWGPCPAPPSPCPADITPAGGDGVVNVNDLLAVINSWGPCQ